MKKKKLQIKDLLYMPAVCLAYFATWFVITNQNLLPGPDGDRWAVLSALAAVGLVVRGLLATV